MAMLAEQDLVTGSRRERRKRDTRARLLEAGYDIMSKTGVDGAKIKDITDRADIGFGTFYNYFETRDQLASQVLDCVINDFGRRNVLATRRLEASDPSLVMPISIRLVMREAARTPIWQWWALRPDLLVDRMREGFAPFGESDLKEGIRLGFFDLSLDEIESAWALAVWMMVGGVHDIITGMRSLDSEAFVVAAIMRTMGVSHDRSIAISSTDLPKYGPAAIDWSFKLNG